MLRGNPVSRGYKAVQCGIERTDIRPVKSIIQVVFGQQDVFGRKVHDQGVVVSPRLGFEAHTVGHFGNGLARFGAPRGHMVAVWFGVAPAVKPSGAIC